MRGQATLRASRVSIFAAALAVVLALAAFVPPMVLDERPVGDSVPTVERWKKAEKRMMNKVNAARERRGKRLLKRNKGVGYVARDHSREMRGSNSLYHSDLERALEDFSWTIAGEAVGRGLTVREIFREFRRSEPHWNVLMHGKFRRMGVGVVTNGDGVKYVTVMLLNY